MKDNFLVIDIGTQSLRASIVSSKGIILSHCQMKYETPYFSSQKGLAEQNVDFYVDEMAKATSVLAEQTPDLMNDTLLGMIVDVFRDSTVILDKEKRPIRPAILWLDQRVTRMPKMPYLKWWERILFSVLGLTDTVRFNAERTQSYWLMKNEPENWEKMAYYCPLGAYFNYCLTGNLIVSEADANGHYPINFKTGKWYSALHPKSDIFSIPRKSLPDIVPVGNEIGRITEEFSKKSKIPVGTILYAAGSDKACENLGNGCVDKNSVSVSLGTACTIEVTDDKYNEPEAFLPAYHAPYKGAYNLEVQIYCGFWMIPWYIKNFGYEDSLIAKEKGVSTEEIMNEKIRDIPVGCDGLVLQPYWGPGLKRPNAKGSIVGFSSVHGKYHLYRAIYEGIAFAMREALDSIIKKTKKKPEYIVVSGGGSRSKEMNQIIADVFNIPCYISNNTESSTIGGAMAGFVSAGYYHSPKEAKDNMFAFGEKIEPIAVNHAIYENLYQKVYLKLYPSIKNVYNGCKEFYLNNIENNSQN